ncbi:choice-of-anchor L domain-containing protein [Nesterenkonia muleiensis]|uniref:choice-of-anchor L domain-containing protein n=1 Tax=Nesterenkonia muleiensis TaxID=2282648 RepID=UPI000E750333|nr:choice-of-anchor L domain-containing protein [Nesterenkonia muleiensis]
MAEELKRRSRLATALIAGPAVTVGLLGVGAAPVLADNHDDDLEDQSIEETEEESGDEDTEGADDEVGSDDDGESSENDDEDESEEEEFGTFQEEDSEDEESGDEPGASVTSDGSVVELTGLPADAFSVRAEHGDQSVGAGTPDEYGNLTFDAAEYISTLGLQPGENELTFSWSWFEDNEEQSDNATVTVEIEASDEGDVSFEVDGPVITATGFPEGVWGVDVEAPSGNTTFASVEEDGTLTFDAAQNVDTLELGFGETTLTFSWTWSDEFGEQEDSAEVVVTAVPPLQTGEDLTVEEIIAGLIGDDTSIDNVQSFGEAFQIGRFSGWDALGIPAGIVLSTGNLPESWQAMTGTGSGSFNDDLDGDGDSDLDAILDSAADEGSNPETQDASGLEFSFVPTESNVRFSYVFASDEYTFLDGSDEPGGNVSFNDIFAFFVNGQNYALFESEDGETLPVSIENINSVANSDLYNDNQPDDDGERPNSGTEIGGYTNVLTFTAPVTPGELNTIKLVVADVNDGIYDSFVVLQGGSFEQVEGPVALGGDFTTDQGEAVGSDFELNTNTDDPEWTINVTDGIDEEAGELEIEGTSWEFTPADDFTGDVSFTFTASDGSLTSAPATITITVVDPDAEDDDDDDGEDTTPPGDDDDDATPPEDEDDAPGDDDDDATPPEDEDDDGASDEEGAEDDHEPAGEVSEDGEELAETGVSSTGVGIIAGLLLLLGGALAVFGYRGRFSRKA